MMEKNDMKMQLRVFHVERGRSVYFDIAIALQSLDVLKAQIEQACCIPVKEQILLMNGGHTVEGIKRLCENKENTDLIYVISRELLKQKSPDLTCDEYAVPDVDLSERVTTCYNMPIAYDTIVQRAYLAQKFHELAKELAQRIERLIDDQHWQQQAWFAVMANFDDTCKDFETRSELFFKQVEIYQANMPKYKEQLENFDKNLELLSKIPVLPVLIQLKENTEALTIAGSPSSEGSSVSVSKNIRQIGYRKSKCMSLLDWIADKDKSFSLKEIAVKCNRLLMELDDKRITRLKEKYNTAMKTCDNPQLKKFESLADRLSSLEQFRASTTLYVSKQRDIDTLFSRNQAGANSLKDVSVLPDICNSHKPQLIFLLQNHEKLKDMKNKCISSKMELCDNLHRRLAMVLTIENVIQETDCSLTAYGMKLNELEYYAKLLEQVDKAPQIYFTFVNEVVRRRNFSDSFLKWGSALSTNLHQVLTEETERRIEFQNQFDHHFISSMFIGLHDIPPKYATEPPLDFDTELPAVTIDDINMLKSEVPDLSETIALPDLSLESKFFQLNKDTIYEEKGVGDDLVYPVDDAKTIDRVSLRPSDSQLSAASSHITHPHLKDIDRGFESETDTEEFEKVCQSPVELQFNSKRPDLTTTKAATLDASTLTEDNLNTAKNEIDRLKSNLVQVSQLSKNAIGLLRAELAAFKNDAVTANEDFKTDCDIIIKTWERFQLECSNQEREKIQRLTVDHELEMNDVKNLAIAKDDEIRSLKHEKIETECSYNRKLDEKTLKLEETQKIYQENVEKCCELEKQIEEIKIENERSENLLKEQMTREHQNELESLRSRFRLMTITNMERSPSDTSLERIERLDVIELVNHESIIAQLKENYYLEKVEAVKNAVEEEKSRWSTKLKEELQRQQIEFELQKQLIISEATRRIIDEKDRQIESLHRENRKFKEMIQQLTETSTTVDSNATVQPLIERVEALEQDKCRLEVELSMERSRKLMAHEMSTSVALFSNQEMTSPPRRDVSTSTDSVSSPRPRKMLTSSQVQLIQTHHVNLSSCKEGDRVLIVFDPSLRNYVLVNEYSSTLYFLNSDCIGALGLRPIDQATRKCTVIGEVTDKEYCIAKKQGNRYNVPQGTRFYRVKVKPLTRDRSRTESVNSTQSVVSSGLSSVETGSVDSKRSSSLTRSSVYERHGSGLDLTVLSQSTDNVPDQGNSNMSTGESMDSSTASTITDPVQLQNQSSGETVMSSPFMYHSVGGHPDIMTGVHRQNLQTLLSQSDYSKTAVAVVSRIFSNAGLVDFSRPIDHSLYQSFGQPASSSSGSYHSVEPVPTVSNPADEIDAGSKR